MPYVTVLKDLSKIEKKYILGLTKRQIKFYTPALVLGGGFFIFIAMMFRENIQIGMYGMILIMAPFFFICNYERNGVYFEKLVKNYIETHYKRNTDRPYQTDNLYQACLREDALKQEVEKIMQLDTEHKKYATSHMHSYKKGKAKELPEHEKKGAQKNKLPEDPKKPDKKKKEPVKISPNMKLTRQQKKMIISAIEKAKRDGKIPTSAQETIPYKKPYPDGTFHVEGDYYTRTIQFFDKDYRLANNEEKESTFENLCDFYNYFDPGIHIQLSYYNIDFDMDEISKVISIPWQDDDFNEIRTEYEKMLNGNLDRGNNGIIWVKHITYGIHAKNYKYAKSRLEKITTDLLNNYKQMRVLARPLNGYQRLELLWQIFHPGQPSKFLFNWDALIKTGLSSKDFIAPSSFGFKDSPRLDATKYFRVGDRIGAASYLSIVAPTLSDEVLYNILEINSNVMVSIHLDAIDQEKAIDIIKDHLVEVQKMKVKEQRHAVQSGYDMDILPPDIITYEEEAKHWLEDLQKRNESMFHITCLIVQTAKTRRELDDNIFEMAGKIRKENCAYVRLDNRQEQGYVSALPIGINQIEIQRSLTTTSTAAFVPFATQELFIQDSGAQYYGMNALSGNMILADRKVLKNPNGLVVGVPGGGKTFLVKREITDVFLKTTDDIMICDPEDEYRFLVAELNGQNIEISNTSDDYINPFDIELETDENPDDVIDLKCEFVLSMMELLIGGKNGLDSLEEGVIDECARKMYENYAKNPLPEEAPIFETFYNSLCSFQGISEIETELARQIAARFKIYVFGSLRVFNHRTNVQLHNRVVCFNIKKLGKKLKKLGMLIIQEQMWNRVSYNRGKKYTRLYLDEFHLLLRDPQTATYSVEIWKRFRKWFGIPTGITQNVKDLLASREIENIFENSDFIAMLSQPHGDLMILAEQLGISQYQMKYVENVGVGRGLLFFGDMIIPFVDEFPQNTKMYKLMTTKPSDLLAAQEQTSSQI